MEAAKLKFTCRKCQCDIVGHMIVVHGFNTSRHFHPDCHQCVVCKKTIATGKKYTVEKEGAKCADCVDEWVAQTQKSPRGGVKVKPSDQRGVVWQMCQAIEAANPPKQERGPSKEGKEGVRDGKMGVCAECKEPIFGILIQVGSKDLHASCHCCKRCKREFGDGETFVRDNSNHTICNSCVSAEHDKKVAARPPMQEEISVVGQASLGKCGSCKKDIFDSSVTFANDKFHDKCWFCQKCTKQLKRGDGCVREGNGFLCENCC